MLRRFLSVVILVAIFAGIMAFAPAEIASAAPLQQTVVTHQTTSAKAELCKSSSSGVGVYAAGYWDTVYYSCSGTYYLDTLPFTMHANQWSGYAYINNGSGQFWVGYCDGDVLSGHELVSLYLSPVRETWCS